MSQKPQKQQNRVVEEERKKHSETKERVAIVSIWFKRGQTYVALQTKKALEQSNKQVYIFARQGSIGNSQFTEKENEFKTVGIYYYPDYHIDPVYFEKFLKDNKIEKVVFIEEQWQMGLGEVCQRLNIPCINIIMWEAFDPMQKEHYNQFDKLVFPIYCGYQKAYEHGYHNAVYSKWGVDLDEWSIKRKERNDDEIRFIHMAGWGGVYQRKQTDFIINAFRKITNPNAKLMICMQTVKEDVHKNKLAPNITLITGCISREEVQGVYSNSDCALAPSKFEGIGLSLLEPQTVGLPVITVDAAPMNEWVMDGINGKVCKVQEKVEYPNIQVEAALCDEDSFIDNINYLCDNKKVLRQLQDGALRACNDDFNWQKNGQRLVDILDDF